MVGTLVVQGSDGGHWTEGEDVIGVGEPESVVCLGSVIAGCFQTTLWQKVPEFDKVESG